MTHRTLVYAFLVAAIWGACALTTPLAHARQDVAANGAVELSEHRPAVLLPESSTPSRQPILGTTFDPPTDDKPLVASASHEAARHNEPAVDTTGTQNAQGKAAADRPASPAQSSISESKPLGKDTGLFNVGAASDSTQDAAGTFSRFDPRRNEFTRVLGALAIVVGLLLLARTFLRRAGGVLPGGARPSGVVEILARYPVARGQELILLKLARRIVLLHHSGSTMTALTEMTAPDEVAALLARMEAGSSERNAAKFRAALEEFQAEHDRLLGRPRRRHNPLADVETEVVDLTRSQGRGLGSLLGRRAVR